ncbi:MAG: type IV secretion protein Rhs [Neisseria sp.]|nr:type IV secretion protein Rhs [Neisseria sp.]
MNARPLSAAEIAAAQTVFGDSLDYSRIRIHRGLPYFPWLNAAIVPNGHIYFPRHACPDDFTCHSPQFLRWLIHELAHVWQWQHGFHTWLGGILIACRGGYWRKRAYQSDAFSRSAHFHQLNMEQQAEAIADLFMQIHYSQFSALFPRASADFLHGKRDFSQLPAYFCHIPRHACA